MKKYQDGGKTGAQLKKEGMAMKAAGKAMKAKGAAMKSDALSKKAALRSTYTPGVRVGNQSMNSDGSMNYSMKTGGATKKYQDGGPTISEKAAERKSAKGKGLYVPTDARTKSKGLYVGYNKAGRKEVKETGGTEVYNLKPVRKVMKTGGMVNSNAKISALKSAGSKGVKSGVNPKAAASKVAKGRVGGTSAAPKTATPKRK